MHQIKIKLPDSLHHATQELAKKENISINQFIMLAIAEKLSALGTEDFIERRAQRANRNKFVKVLDNAPNIEPDEEDKL